MDAKKVMTAVKIEHDHGLRKRACRKREDERSGEGWPMGKRCDADEEEAAEEVNGIIMGGRVVVRGVVGVVVLVVVVVEVVS